MLQCLPQIYKALHKSLYNGPMKDYFLKSEIQPWTICLQISNIHY